MPMPANHRLPAALFSIGLPTPALVVLRPSAWFLHWPVMFAGALILALVLKASLASARSFLRKAVKIGIAVCLLQGFVMFLDWKPSAKGVYQAEPSTLGTPGTRSWAMR